jgi:hypothetical protein
MLDERAARPEAAHQAGVHRRLNGGYTMTMAERGRLGQERW